MLIPIFYINLFEDQGLFGLQVQDATSKSWPAPHVMLQEDPAGAAGSLLPPPASMFWQTGKLTVDSTVK